MGDHGCEIDVPCNAFHSARFPFDIGEVFMEGLVYARCHVSELAKPIRTVK